MSIAPPPVRNDAETDSIPAFDLSAHAAIRAALDNVTACLAQRDKVAAVALLLDIDALLGHGWHPARRPLRGIDAALDIGRWDLAGDWITQVGDWFGPHPEVDAEQG